MSDRELGGEGRYLPPWLLQLVGVLLLVGSVIFWAFTGHESALIMSSAMTLILIGAYRAAAKTLKKEISPPTKREEKDP